MNNVSKSGERKRENLCESESIFTGRWKREIDDEDITCTWNAHDYDYSSSSSSCNHLDSDHHQPYPYRGMMTWTGRRKVKIDANGEAGGDDDHLRHGSCEQSRMSYSSPSLIFSIIRWNMFLCASSLHPDTKLYINILIVNMKKSLTIESNGRRWRKRKEWEMKKVDGKVSMMFSIISRLKTEKIWGENIHFR